MIIRIVEKKTDRVVSEIKTDEEQLPALMPVLEKQYNPQNYIIEFDEIRNEELGNVRDALKSVIPVISVFIIPIANILLLLSLFIVQDAGWKAAGIGLSVILLIIAAVVLRRAR